MSDIPVGEVRPRSHPVLVNPRKRRRVRNHVSLAIVSAILVLIIFTGLQPADTMFRLSMATAYASLALLALTLLTGPWNVLRARPNPVSSDLRRDLGIWTGVIGLAHVVAGLQVHFRDRMWLYFFAPSNERGLVPFRFDWFGVANYTGLLATLCLVMLLTLSNDRAIRTLGRRRWKALQRLNYALFGVVAMHALLYQKLEDRAIVYIVLAGLTVCGVVGIQAAGVYHRLRSRGQV